MKKTQTTDGVVYSHIRWIGLQGLVMMTYFWFQIFLAVSEDPNQNSYDVPLVIGFLIIVYGFIISLMFTRIKITREAITIFPSSFGLPLNRKIDRQNVAHITSDIFWRKPILVIVIKTGKVLHLHSSESMRETEQVAMEMNQLI